MQTVEYFRRKLQNAGDLQSIVHTMKVLASVSIRQFERAAESLGEYYRTIEMGLQIVMNPVFQEEFPYMGGQKKRETAIIVLGSGQGLCGSFDEQIFDFTSRQLKEQKVEDPLFLVLGERVAARLDASRVEGVFDLPGSVAGLNKVAIELLTALESLRREKSIGQVLILHHKPIKQGRYVPRMQLLLPLDRHWLNRLAAKEWPTNNIPQYSMKAGALFSQLVNQYLLVSLYRAMAESLAAEHMSRLNAMSMAEKKIEERLLKLHNQYARERQNAITDELLDILSGYLAVKGEDEY
ncbi:F0F1 ATP synthase subunit gamma [Fodinibius sediminis]|uniref:F-type H+-transporting ATPase subunit gamma n=1 Tax=Fodinibius sediminis TaxID=1214077 RepID=A0A521CU86_9BACT|nr:F0F1 ATP synthase subunit gamma [Fodinibius sediminis]SMO62983.1 F-type H+-transporting ATPase subunit gamma [Fodinibius sediminis]